MAQNGSGGWRRLLWWVTIDEVVFGGNDVALDGLQGAEAGIAVEYEGRTEEAVEECIAAYVGVRCRNFIEVTARRIAAGKDDAG